MNPVHEEGIPRYAAASCLWLLKMAQKSNGSRADFHSRTNRVAYPFGRAAEYPCAIHAIESLANQRPTDPRPVTCLVCVADDGAPKHSKRRFFIVNVKISIQIVLTLIVLSCFSTLAERAAAQGQDPFRLDAPAESEQGGEQDTNDDDSGTADETQADDQAGDETASDETAGTGEEGADETADNLPTPLDELGEVNDLSDVQKWGSVLLVEYGVPAIIAIVLLIVAYFIASFLARVASAPVRKKVDETLGKFFGKLIFYVIMVSAVLGVLQYFGIGVASFAAVIAAAGFAVGLAFQGTLSNFAAGIMLLVFRPFKVGDVVNAAGITAKVFEIDLFATKFDTFDNRRIIVPNSSISNDTIENISFHLERRVEVSVGVDYGASLDKTREILASAAELLGEITVQGENRGFQILVTELGDSAVTWAVRVWVKTEDFATAKEKLIEAIKNQLDAAGIGIPFPQMDVHLLQSSAE